MTGATLCSGIGAPETAIPWVDWRWCAEIEKFPSAVLAVRHPRSVNLGDITAADFINRALAASGGRVRMNTTHADGCPTKTFGLMGTITERLEFGAAMIHVDGDKLPSLWAQGDFTPTIDLLVAGTPCQAFSVAGLRKSLDDKRGNLTLRFVEIVHAIKPGIVLWENVPGVLSTHDNAFGCFLGGLVGAAEAIAPTAGWTSAGVVAGPLGTAAWRILDAQYFGLAQRRRRVFVVFSPGNRIDPAEVLFEFESLRRDYPPSREAGQGTSHDPVSSLTGSGRGVERPGESRGQDPVIAMCLNGKGGAGRIDGESETFITHALRANGVRRLTPKEAERLQGFPDGYTAIQYRGKLAADGPRYRALGNSMAVPVLRWIGERIAKQFGTRP